MKDQMEKLVCIEISHQISLFMSVTNLENHLFHFQRKKQSFYIL